MQGKPLFYLVSVFPPLGLCYRCSCGKYPAEKNKEAPAAWPENHKEESQEIRKFQKYHRTGGAWEINPKKLLSSPSDCVYIGRRPERAIDRRELLDGAQAQNGHQVAHVTDRCGQHWRGSGNGIDPELHATEGSLPEPNQVYIQAKQKYHCSL